MIAEKVIELAKEYPEANKTLVLSQSVDLLHHYAYNIEYPKIGVEYLDRQEKWVIEQLETNLKKGLYVDRPYKDSNQQEFDLGGD